MKHTVHKIHRPHLSTASDARAVRTREALRRALLDLLAVKPLDVITIRDITAMANVGYTTFFRHHPTKDALFQDVVAGLIGRLIDLTLPILEARDTRAASLALCTYVAEHRELWSTLLTGGAAGALRTQFLRLSMQVVFTRSNPDSWFPPDVAVTLVVSSTIELLSWWLRQSRPMSIRQIAEIHDRVIIAPAVRASERQSVVSTAKPRRKKSAG